MRGFPAPKLFIAIVVAAALGGSTPGAAAAETGTIRGRVTNETTGVPQRDVEITLYSALSDGSGRFERSATTDAGGRFEFAGLPTGDDRIYALDSRYDGGLFSSPALQLPANTTKPPVIRTKVRVWNTIGNPEAIVIQRSDTFVTSGEGGLSVIEAVKVVNLTDRAYVGRGAGGPGEDGAPTLGFSLPPDAGGVRIIDSSLEIPGLVPTDFGFGINVAVPPGNTTITYGYTTSGSAGIYDISRTALYPTLNTSVYAAGAIDVRSNRLRPGGEETIGGTDYRIFSASDTIDSGNQLQVVAEARPEGSSVFVAGLLAAGALALVAAVVALVVRRRRRVPRARLPGPEPQGREEILRAVAHLDISYRSGDVGDDEYRQRRAELKALLAGERTPEHAP